MKIGIDLRALQTGHKYRGIGEVAKQTTNRILVYAYDQSPAVSFVFYEYDDDDPKELLNIPAGLNYEVVKLGIMPENDISATVKDKVRRNLIKLYGNPIKDSKKCDVFLQFDYAFGVPNDVRSVLVKHDLIPYIFWDKYFESAWVPFKNKALRTTLRTLFANTSYLRILRRSLKDAHVILSVSQSTKRDLERYFNVKSSKVKVAHLGVTVEPAKTGDVTDMVNMPTKPYLLFIGAGDARRRVDDAVAAFNNLRANGHDIQLVLAGENFKSPEKIPNAALRNAVLQSSYKNDILTLGYIDDTAKQTLYRNAVAFVYPTQYEGFGIPILEAMLLGCPVITYKNSSTAEVGGEHAYYAKNWMQLMERVEWLLTLDPMQNSARKQAAQQFAEQFTWDKTAAVIYDELTAKKNSK